MPTKFWFATPVYKGTLSDDELALVSREIDDAIEAAQASAAFGTPWREPALSTTFKYDGKSNIIKERDLRHLAGQLLKHTQHFCAELGIDRYQSMDIENSWINVSKPSGFQFAHTHEPSMVSGVYYHRTSGEDGNIVFESPNPYFNAYDFPNNGAQCQKNIEYTPKVGHLLLFPSWLTHYVDVNRTPQERISLSFNMRLRRTPVPG
jgi:uncharacterized protein (TIGR02466 family)